MRIDTTRLEKEMRERPQYRYYYACGAKIECPMCGQKTFVPLFDKETGEVIEEKGRCDRENNCGYIAKINTNGVTTRTQPYMKKQEVEFATEEQWHEMHWEGERLKADTSDLVEWLYTLGYKKREIRRAINWFGICRLKGAVVFPLYNASTRLIRFKQIWYKDGKRTKYIKQFPANGINALFGWQQTPTIECFIVESEKTAILGFLEYYEKHGKFSHWIATGGTNGLGASFIEELKKCKRVVFYPDCDDAGREAFAKYAGQLPNSEIIDIDHSRNDGYDLGDKIKWKRQNKQPSKEIRKSKTSSNALPPWRTR